MASLTTILNGESFICDFDLTSLFEKLVDTTTYTDVKIYLYHKQLLKNVGFDAATDYWGDADGNITITGVDNDQARITINEARTDDIEHGVYMFMVELEDTVPAIDVIEKKKGNAFIIGTAIDE